ncbi:response regulator transcription factor [Lysobacter sp. K5869]|uniref:response regulator n=1 Tax=Lysobacter sp. K5869 TaxID=2820808 RepID=UPI001C05F43B|nr:response regulator transcription factor [Lysobacter sp. K5869]QWP77069.1 response regulator transcription factor [Lysobacter sp. K5869]
MIRVFIVDDQPLVRLGLRWILGAHSDFEVVGEAGDPHEAIARVAQSQADVALCGFNLPDGDSLGLVRRLLHRDPALRILVVSAVGDGPLPRRLLAAGALGYVSKSRDGAVVVRALREVAAGRRFIDDSLGGRLLFESSPFDRLSPRELEVARMLLEGRRNREIAAALRVTESTVRTLRSRALSKLDVRGEGALVRLAMDHGLVGRGTKC